jgi:2-hydroxy-6-oxonona-2,4-dienedioate hydrolase
MLNYRRFGSGPTVVLQHGGFGGGSGYFAILAAHLAANFDVIATDMPGLAGSANEPVPDSIPGIAESLLSTLNELKVDRFMLLGHSLGSMTALQAALDHPERIEKLILYGGSATCDLPHRFETLEETIARLESEGIELISARTAATWFVDGAKHPLYEFTRNAGSGASKEAAIRLIRGQIGWDVRDRLGEVAMPTLVICGDSDRSCHPDCSYEMWRGIPEAQLCILPNCAHNAHLEMAEVFDLVIGRFLRA